MTALFSSGIAEIDCSMALNDARNVSNADSEFYLLTNGGLSTTLKGYFTQDIPAIKYLRREINGHFDMPYDY